jgi:hypothetical protein
MNFATGTTLARGDHVHHIGNMAPANLIVTGLSTSSEVIFNGQWEEAIFNVIKTKIGTLLEDRDEKYKELEEKCDLLSRELESLKYYFVADKSQWKEGSEQKDIWIFRANNEILAENIDKNLAIKEGLEKLKIKDIKDPKLSLFTIGKERIEFTDQ